MEENMNKGTEMPMAANNSCKCGKNWCMCGRRHYVLRLLLGLVILVVVFAIGVKVGEFKSRFGGSRRGSIMMRHYPNPMMGANPGAMYRRMPGTTLPMTATSTPLK